jgi:hypothetical protein
VLAVFNALPGLPLDGGRVVEALVWARTGDPNRGRVIAGQGGQVVAAITALLAIVGSARGYVSVVGALFTLLVAAMIWQGAVAATRAGRADARVKLLDLARLTRPLYRVPAGTSLAEAQRRAADSGHRLATIAVEDGDGRLTAVVQEAAAAAVPVARRPWIAVDEVSRAVDPDRSVPTGATGAAVVEAVQADPTGDYLVTSGKDVVGILRVVDLVQFLDQRGNAR